MAQPLLFWPCIAIVRAMKPKFKRKDFPMSIAQVEETVKALDAKAVQEVLEATGNPQAATATYPITISIFEQFGRAFISWQLDPNCAIGAQDVVQLRENDKWINNWFVKTTSGEVDTGRTFGSNLNASYWSWSYGTASGWRQLVVTPNT